MIVIKRGSGVLMHISSLWGNYSIGSFGKEALEWIDFLYDCGFTFWQVLPFCQPDEFNSPYKSFGAFSVNPYFIDLETLYNEGLITKQELEKAIQKSPYNCEFSRLNDERINLLAKAANNFSDISSLNAFYEKHPQVEEYCKFMALREANNHSPWNTWKITEINEHTLFTWKFIQYTFFKQWSKIKDYANKKGISILGDIPIYVSWDSADVWANTRLFQLNDDYTPKNVAGVPPDYFSADGQLWGNPLYNYEEMEKDNFSWWQSRIEFMLELFDGIRIDHFRGFESYFSIDSKEKTAKNGKWVKGPGVKLINAIKKVCGDSLIIAEDLGDITPEVKQLVEDSGFSGMRVMQFGFLNEDYNSTHLPHNYNNNCIAYTGTHDNNTLLGYVWDLDDYTRKRMLNYFNYSDSNWDNCYGTILKSMFSSHAGLLILPVQDLLFYGNDTRLNKPGVADNNWSYRVTKNQLNEINKAKFLEWNTIYGRI